MLRSVIANVDEIIIGVDSATSDDTVARAGKYATRLIPIHNPQGFIEPHIQILFEACTGDWILRLDDDELMSTNFNMEDLRRTVLDNYDLVGFPRPWMISRDPLLYVGTGAQGSLVPQYRLMRRATEWRFVTSIHTPGFEMKDAAVVSDVYLYHMNLLDFSAEARRQKYAFYQSQRDAPWNMNYLINVDERVASGDHKAVTENMYPPTELIRSRASDFR